MPLVFDFDESVISVADIPISSIIAFSFFTATSFFRCARNDSRSLIVSAAAAAETIKERESLRAQRKKDVAVKKLKAMMDEMGISATDITDSSKSKTNGKRAARPKKGNKVAPKYQITVDGVTHQWTGRGRTPVVFRSHVENGGSLDDCLI